MGLNSLKRNLSSKRTKSQSTLSNAKLSLKADSKKKNHPKIKLRILIIGFFQIEKKLLIGLIINLVSLNLLINTY